MPETPDEIKLSALQLDALREVGNMGAGRAATALSQMLGQTINITVPKASVIRLEDLPDPLGGPDALVAATYFHVHGDAPGRLLIFMTQEALPHILTLLMGQPPKAGAPLSAEEQSALKELGNILCSQYLNALADLMQVQLLPSVPALAYDMVRSVMQSVLADAAEEGAQALMIENQFLEAKRPVALYLFYLPQAGGLESMLAQLAKATGTDFKS
jgi:chemotaxis protein CheC